MATSSPSPVPSGDNLPTMTGPTINRESEKRSPPSFSKPTQFVTIIVSQAPTEQRFVVHKELICFHSPFFHAAFNGKFIEGQTQEMRMEDVDEDTFGQLVHWLYTQEFEYPKIRDVLLLGKLWILAERALIPKLQNTTIDALYRILRGPMVAFPSRTPDMQDLVTIVLGEHTKEHPILRSLLVDHFASMDSCWSDTWAEDLPQKLLVQLTKALAKDREDSRGKHRSVLATDMKVSDYYVEVPTEEKDDAATSQRKTEKKPVRKPSPPPVRPRSLVRLDSDDASLYEWADGVFYDPVPTPPSSLRSIPSFSQQPPIGSSGSSILFRSKKKRKNQMLSNLVIQDG